MWFIGVEVEQERVHPLLKKNPGSAPVPHRQSKAPSLLMADLYRFQTRFVIR